MRYLALVLVLCGFAAAAPAHAFEIQGEKATLEDGANSSQFASPASPLLRPDYSQGHSLALPFIGSADSQFLSDYGNGISIPAPGVDQAAPAWALPR